MSRRIITSTGSPEWVGLFTSFTHSAFRLEGLQHYTAPDEEEAFARFRRGMDPEVDLSWWIVSIPMNPIARSGGFRSPAGSEAA